MLDLRLQPSVSHRPIQSILQSRSNGPHLAFGSAILISRRYLRCCGLLRMGWDFFSKSAWLLVWSFPSLMRNWGEPKLSNNDSARAPRCLFFELTRRFTNIPSIKPSRLPRRMDLRSADRVRSCLRIPRQKNIRPRLPDRSTIRIPTRSVASAITTSSSLASQKANMSSRRRHQWPGTCYVALHRFDLG